MMRSYRWMNKMNIKEQIQEANNSNENFAFSSSAQIQREKFKNLTNRFLTAKTYGESERTARRLMNFILYQHDKATAVGPVLESLNNFELFGEYNYGQQRLHFSHQAYVFLLGLFLYHSVPIIKNYIDNEMELTTKDMKVDGTNMRYSGQTKFGEFLYRWRLASLSHDLGYGISLSDNDETKIKEYLEEISTFLITDIKSLEDLWCFEDNDLLCQLDSQIAEISLRDYIEYQKNNPFKGSVSVYYDHGLISSLIFLRLMNEEYARHRHRCNQVSRVGFTKIIWHESFLSGSILQTAIVIALHNLDQHKDALQQTGKTNRIFNLEAHPLTWLLKICDILQEWDKPIAKEETMTKKIEHTDIQVLKSQDKIVVKNFPKEKLEKVNGIIKNYTDPPDIIKFE